LKLRVRFPSVLDGLLDQWHIVLKPAALDQQDAVIGKMAEYFPSLDLLAQFNCQRLDLEGKRGFIGGGVDTAVRRDRGILLRP
jgi:hypothetical protein